MKKLNFTWNNTDWSVSKDEIATQSEQHRNRDMKNTEATKYRNTRHIRAFPQFVVSPTTDHEVIEPLIQRARQEAAAIAWSTDYPFLLLPCLTEELEHEAREYDQRQKQIRERSALLFPQTFPVAARQLAA